MIPKISEAKQKIIDALNTILKDGEVGTWILERQNVEKIRQRFSHKVMALVSFDVDKIKDLVFASTKPLEVQGASEIVRDLTLNKGNENQKELPECSVYSIIQKFGLSESNILFAGGGTGLLLTPLAIAEKVSEEIRHGFAKHSMTGSCSVVWRGFSPYELVMGPEMLFQQIDTLPPGVSMISNEHSDGMKFGRIIQLLADQLRDHKDSRLTPSLPILPGFIHICESCGIRAATCYDRGQTDWLCQSCNEHRQRGRKERSELQKHNDEFLTAEDISQIAGEEFGERGYVAVVHADVNGMGQILFDLGKMEEYTVFSQAVSYVMEKVTHDLVIKHRLKCRYQAPIIGGDDILMIVPALKAARMVSDLVIRVRTEFSRLADWISVESSILSEKLRNLTISVGFVIVPSHFNIRFSVDYAESLLRSAKSETYIKGQECVDWMVIKEGSPLSTEIGSLREGALVRESGREWKLTLTDKPVLLNRFNDMLKWISLMKQHSVSKSQLRNIQSLIEQESPLVAKLNMRYQWLRTKEWEEFLKALEDSEELTVSQEKWMADFVMQEVRPRIYKTGFLDIMELYEFDGGLK